MEKFDVFVIGTGVAGTIVANKCASAGLKTGIADSKEFGGACALDGCIPKKILVNATHVIQQAKNLEGKGICEKPLVIWKDLIAFKNTIVDPIPAGKEKSYKKNNVITYHNKAVFSAGNQLRVGNEVVEAQKIVIATGSTPRQLTIPGIEHALLSGQFFEMGEMPKSVLFIGGGYIALEFAHIAARLGSKVTILDLGEAPLSHFEPDIVLHLVHATKALGIEMVMNTNAVEIIKNENGFIVIGDTNGNKNEYKCDVVFNTSGRVPAIIDLNLEVANVSYSNRGIEVNSYMQSTTNPHVYAAGDNTHTDGLPLTPFATMEAHIVASNIIEGNNKKPDYHIRPTVVFTVPPVATVGMTEKETTEKGFSIKVNYRSVPHWFSAVHKGEKTYAFKIIIDTQTDLILGAHLIGPNAQETINLFALAIKAGVKASDLKTIPFTYPTDGSDIAMML